MDAFRALQFVTSGLALVAFVAAAVLMAYRAKLKKDEVAIKELGPEHPKLLAIIREAVSIELERLPVDRRAEVALAELRLRENRHRTNAVVVVVLGAIFAAVAVLSFLSAAQPIPGPAPKPSGAEGYLRDFRDAMNRSGAVIVTLAGERAEEFWFDRVTAPEDRNLPDVVCRANRCLVCTASSDGRTVSIALVGRTRTEAHPRGGQRIRCVT